MDRSPNRANSWGRSNVMHLATIVVLPLAALVFWQTSRFRDAGAGLLRGVTEAHADLSVTRLNETPSGESSALHQTTDSEVGTSRRAETSLVSHAALMGRNHPPPDLLRDAALSRLHREATRRFVMSPGNGVGRIGQIGQIGMLGQIAQTNQLGQINQLGQLGRIGGVYQQLPTFPKIIARDWTIPTWSPGELTEAQRVDGEEDLDILHKESLTDFSREPSAVPVSGSLPPSGPRKLKAWEVKNIDLVGLLIHERPVVYVSEKLQMSNLKEVPTRDLDFFEVAGLDNLQNGKELFAHSRNETIRLLGAVRAQKQCLSCHDVKEGKLLGAFSYTLRIAQYRSPTVDESKADLKK